MTAAAKLIGVTQPAVSQLIYNIEKELGSTLFDRSRRPLRLTASGAALVKRAQTVVVEAEQIVAATGITTTVPQLRVGVIDSFAGAVGPQIVKVCMERVDNLTLWSGLTVRLREDFRNRRVDLIICAEEGSGDSDLRQIFLLREPFILAMPKGLWEPGEVPDLQRLSRDVPMIRYSARSHTGMQIELSLGRLGLRPTRRLEMDTSESVFPMVAAGVGWAITTPLCVFQSKPDLDLVQLLRLPGPAISRQIVLVHRRGEYDELADQIAELTWTVMERQILPALQKSIPHTLDGIVLHRRESRITESAILPAGNLAI